jgi:hypothetical protein
MLQPFDEKTRLGLPDKLTIIGFDGLTAGQYMVPKLTVSGCLWYRVAFAARGADRSHGNRRTIDARRSTILA